MNIEILKEIPCGFDLLERKSKEEGFEFLTKMKISWEDRKNYFNKPGEALYGIFQDNEIAAICGRNIDPYINDVCVGRVRHLYVIGAYRRKGLAKLLVERVLKDGQEHFKSIRLRTHNPQACEFYKAMGFAEVENDEFATHIWKY